MSEPSGDDKSKRKAEIMQNLLSGCCGEPLPPQAMPWATRFAEYIADAITSEHPPGPTAVTSQLLAETPDDQLWVILVDYVRDYLHHFRGDEYDQAFLRLPKGLQMAWHVAGIEFEVPNGGFWQFFYNSTGKFAPETLEALRAFGASDRAAVLQQAIELYEKEVGRPANSHERWFGDDCKSPELEVLGHRYCQLVNDELLSGFAPYVRANPAEFLHP